MMTEPNQEAIERRTIRSRETRWAHAIAAKLGNAGISPNSISLFGMLAAMAAGLAFYATSTRSGISQRVLWLAAGLLCQVRLLCNLFDGMVAVNQNIASTKGELYNEVPDRISDSAIFIGLGFAAGSNPDLGYLAALVSVLAAYVRAMAKSLGAANDFCGPMAKPQRMALVTILAIYLAISPKSWRVEWGEAQFVLVLVIVGGLVTCLRRLSRAAHQLEASQR